MSQLRKDQPHQEIVKEKQVPVEQGVGIDFECMSNHHLTNKWPTPLYHHSPATCRYVKYLLSPIPYQDSATQHKCPSGT